MVHRVLCVDDDPACLRSLVRRLRAMPGVEADGVLSAEAARSKVATADYAMVISDHRMPGETGVDLFASLTELAPDTVRILLTAYADLDVALDAINRGHVYALIRKPWLDEELVMMVARACERFNLGRELQEKVVALERVNQELARQHSDLQAARREVDRLADVAATDDKTGARSHRFFAERLDEEVARSRRYDHPLSLMLVGLDGFKSVNDRFGHVAGDTVLRSVASLLRSGIRVMDVLARFGGDEFAVILPDTNLCGASTLGDRLGERVRTAELEPVGRGRITLSIGLAAMPHEGVESGDELIRCADGALYEAKQLGKDRVVSAQKT